ncbi:uncharacterized protein LOC106172899 [Lingula anatina]|uniref:Uncharacterized protein LOC106172899 n=1 Tax=Lingula anatina TaxID=7574 RepID=A0A1S3JGK9_LINAN|nr:uncharacterized protein LOC106172899 [Lingula anatina]|eukprot:XP_013409281.1 uncharacterized protein LOC106172899 [Lingula anatina]
MARVLATLFLLYGTPAFIEGSLSTYGHSFIARGSHLDNGTTVIASLEGTTEGQCMTECQASSQCEATNYDTLTGLCQHLDTIPGTPSLTCNADWVYATKKSLTESQLPDSNLCSPNPCMHGTCTRSCDAAAGYTCTCEEGFAGARCNESVSSCPDRLLAGEKIHRTDTNHPDSLCSASGRYKLYVETDGDVVIYDLGEYMNADPPQLVWHSNTSGTNDVYFTLQNDGNLVSYDSGNTAHFSIDYTIITGTPFSPSHIVLENDGGLRYYDVNGLLRWDSKTAAITYMQGTLRKTLADYNHKGFPIGSHWRRPASSCFEILSNNASYGTGIYFIRPRGDTGLAARTWCDMDFDGGGWTLVSYGYMHSTGNDGNSRNLVNMNRQNGYNWDPISRANSHGLIPLQDGAIKIANNANYMLMAAGNNPTTGTIDEYSHAYKIDIRHKKYTITFENHSHYKLGTHMHSQAYTVTAMKGESGTATRYALAEALGVTWSSSFPAGYGFNENDQLSGSFDKGPFFPSVHSGSGTSCSCTCSKWDPDVTGGNRCYSHRGWYSLNGNGYTGAMSIWFK